MRPVIKTLRFVLNGRPYACVVCGQLECLYAFKINDHDPTQKSPVILCEGSEEDAIREYLIKEGFVEWSRISDLKECRRINKYLTARRNKLFVELLGKGKICVP